MTYFGFLAVFLILPILVLLLILLKDPSLLVRRTIPKLRVIGLLAAVAVIYTTPWDNYLVANQVWWYDPERVTGITVGWVPIEEYTFFVLQTLLCGLWIIYLTRRVKILTIQPMNRNLNWSLTVGASLVWLCAGYILLSGWKPGTYIALILIWAMPPLILQFAYGADILWRYREIVIPAILVPAIYLSITDSLAIQTGIWTISPQLTLGFLITGILPIEEFIFFFFTVILVTFGLTLALAVESKDRIKQFRLYTYFINALEIK